MSKALYTTITMVCACYAFLVGFILAICVFMSNADMSPEISLTSSHPIRSVLLLALVAWPFVSMLAIGHRTLLGPMMLAALCMCVAGVGFVCATSDHGAFEAFSGTDALRRGAGKVYFATSLIVLVLIILRMREDRRRY